MNVDILESNWCCGLKEVGYFPYGNIEEQVASDVWNSDINKVIETIIDYFCNYGQVFCTVSMENQKWMYELLLAVGFEEVKRWKSNHGDYELVMLIN